MTDGREGETYYTSQEAYTALWNYLLQRDDEPLDAIPGDDAFDDPRPCDSSAEVGLSAAHASNLSCLKSNDIYSAVKRSSGERDRPVPHRCDTNSYRHVLSKLKQREHGLRSISHADALTGGDKCFLNNQFLPNSMKKVIKCRSKLFCGQFTLDGTRFVSACQDQRIRLYDTSSGHFMPLKQIEARDVGWSVVDVAVSPDGRDVIYSSWSEYIHECNMQASEGDTAGKHIAFNLRPREARFCVFSLKYSSDGSEILAGASDRCLYVYDRVLNCRSLKINGHENDVNAVAFADRSSQIILSAGDDGLCKVWDRRALSEENPAPIGTFGGHTDGITFIDSKGDSRYLITNSKDQSIKLWDLRRFASNDVVNATKRAVEKQDWDYRWQSVPRTVLAASRNRRGAIVGDPSVCSYFGSHTVLHTLIRCFFSPAFHTGQRFIYTGCASGACCVYDLLTGERVTVLRGGHTSCVRDVSWHPYENMLVTSSWDGMGGLWTYANAEKRLRSRGSNKGECDEAYASDLVSDEEERDQIAEVVARRRGNTSARWRWTPF